MTQILSRATLYTQGSCPKCCVAAQISDYARNETWEEKSSRFIFEQVCLIVESMVSLTHTQELCVQYSQAKARHVDAFIRRQPREMRYPSCSAHLRHHREIVRSVPRNKYALVCLVFYHGSVRRFEYFQDTRDTVPHLFTAGQRNEATPTATIMTPTSTKPAYNSILCVLWQLSHLMCDKDEEEEGALLAINNSEACENNDSNGDCRQKTSVAGSSCDTPVTQGFVVSRDATRWRLSLCIFLYTIGSSVMTQILPKVSIAEHHKESKRRTTGRWLVLFCNSSIHGHEIGHTQNSASAPGNGSELEVSLLQLVVTLRTRQHLVVVCPVLLSYIICCWYELFISRSSRRLSDIHPRCLRNVSAHASQMSRADDLGM